MGTSWIKPQQDRCVCVCDHSTLQLPGGLSLQPWQVLSGELQKPVLDGAQWQNKSQEKGGARGTWEVGAGPHSPGCLGLESSLPGSVMSVASRGPLSSCPTDCHPPTGCPPH